MNLIFLSNIRWYPRAEIVHAFGGFEQIGREVFGLHGVRPCVRPANSNDERPL